MNSSKLESNIALDKYNETDIVKLSVTDRSNSIDTDIFHFHIHSILSYVCGKLTLQQLYGSDL